MSDLVSEIQDLLEAEAQDSLASGWAEVRLSEPVIGPTLHLEPMKIRAAPLEVHFDSDQLLVCYPGRNSMVVEFFSEDPEEIKPQVRALAAAVVGGRYCERKQEGTTEVEARWPDDGGIQRATRSLIKVPGRESNVWREIAYEAY